MHFLFSFSASICRRARPTTVAMALVATVVFGALSMSGFPVGADLKEDLEKLEQEQEEVKAQQEAQARAINASTAESSELAAALAALNARVADMEGDLVDAETQLAKAESTYRRALQAVTLKSDEIVELKRQVSDRAVSAFLTKDLATNPVLEDTDPNRAIRMHSLVEAITRTEVDVADQLEEAQQDLAIEEALADEAAGEAEQVRATIEADLIALGQARDEQSALAAEAEARLERQLAEAAILAERDKDLASQITETNDELARQAALAAARAAARNNPAPRTQSNTKFPTADEIVNVQGFWVHVDIADNLDKMLNAARSDGIEFGGWAYRDHSAQIRLRKAHCGTSEWAIYQKPSSTCRPPTARPGNSQHELGKAIDFTHNGSTINSRSNSAYKWLKANAANYGLYNLPSEPWHWSVNGR